MRASTQGRRAHGRERAEEGSRLGRLGPSPVLAAHYTVSTTALRPNLTCQWVDAARLDAATAVDPCVLGAIQFGGEAVLAPLHALPHTLLNKPALAPAPLMVEIWSGATAAIALEAGGIRCRHNGEILFGAVSVDVPIDIDNGLDDAAFAAYRAVLECLRATGYPHLLRVWNSIPDINRDDAGLERYRRFNSARFRAFDEARLPTQTGSPAATALGTFGGPLVVQFLAGRAAATAVENPRQVSAYHYPKQYGPRAPSFSRGALWRSGEQHILFISGTASIVGHETRHRGDVVAQTHEIVANLEAVLAQAQVVARNQGALEFGVPLAGLQIKTYLRHRDDLPDVRAALAAHGIDTARVLFLLADICRADLLVEIEALGAAAA